MINPSSSIDEVVDAILEKDIDLPTETVEAAEEFLALLKDVK
jgi:hypothetical protein